MATTIPSILGPPAPVITSTVQHLRQSECAFFHYNNWTLMMWVIASVFCFLALLSTIYSVYNAYRLWSTIQDLENAVIDLIDDACQILLPLGVCKQICHPHHIGTVNANYVPKGHKEEQKLGKKENRYPEDVTFPPSDIEKVYDVMGDEDARKSKSLSVSTVVPPSTVPPTVEKNDKVQETQKSGKANQQNTNPLTPTKGLSKELQKTPAMSKEPGSDKKKQSLKATPVTPKPSAEAASKTPSREKPTLSREPATARSGSGSAKLKTGSKKKTTTPQKAATAAPATSSPKGTPPASPNPKDGAMKPSAEVSNNPNP